MSGARSYIDTHGVGVVNLVGPCEQSSCCQHVVGY